MPNRTRTTRSKDTSAADDEQAIRQRVRDLTSQMFKDGKLDPETAREVMHVITGSTAFEPDKQEAKARQAFTDAIHELNDAMLSSAQSAHAMIEQLAAKGSAYSDNEVKETLARLKTLQESFAAVTNHVADTASGNLRRELADLAVHAQHVGADAGARVASALGEFANRLGNLSREGTSSGLDAMRDYGVRTVFITSGILAGVADALSEQSGNRKSR